MLLDARRYKNTFDLSQMLEFFQASCTVTPLTKDVSNTPKRASHLNSLSYNGFLKHHAQDLIAKLQAVCLQEGQLTGRYFPQGL